MNAPLFFAVFATLTFFYLILGLIASRRVKTTSDYFLAGQNLGVLSVAFTLIATQLGSGLLLGTSQQAYFVGIYGLLYTAGIIIGFLLLGCGLASKLRGLGVATTAQLFETHFNSQILKKIASLLSVLTLCGLFIGQIVASKMVITALNIENELIFITFWLCVILYTIIGGLEAVVFTDIFQVSIITIIFFSIFIYSFSIDSINWFSLPTLFIIQKTYFSELNLPINTMIATLCMPALYSLIEQDLAQRFFSARTKKIAIVSAFCAALFMFLFSLIPIYLGMKARLLGLPLLSNSPLIPVIELMGNDLVLVLALCAILAASTSTADSLLCAISSNLAQDFSFGSRLLTPLQRSKVITLVVGSIALITSYFVPQNIIEILIKSYEISVNCLLVPSLCAYFAQKMLPTEAAWGSIIFGLTSLLLLPLWETTFPTALLPLVFSGIGYLIGLFLAIVIKKRVY